MPILFFTEVPLKPMFKLRHFTYIYTINTATVYSYNYTINTAAIILLDGKLPPCMNGRPDLCCCDIHNLNVHEVTFVSYQELADICAGITINLIQPCPHILERLLLVNQKDG